MKPVRSRHDADRRRARADTRAWFSSAWSLVGLLLLYFAWPAGSKLDGPSLVGLLGAAGGVLLFVVALRRFSRNWVAGSVRTVRVVGLLHALELVVVVFSTIYYQLAVSTDQLIGISTRLDALYFTITTLSTVGFGDIQASGQLARAVVSVQMAFDIVFVAALVGIFTGSVRQQAEEQSVSILPAKEKP